MFDCVFDKVQVLVSQEWHFQAHKHSSVPYVVILLVDGAAGCGVPLVPCLHVLIPSAKDERQNIVHNSKPVCPPARIPYTSVSPDFMGFHHSHLIQFWL